MQGSRAQTADRFEFPAAFGGTSLVVQAQFQREVFILKDLEEFASGISGPAVFGSFAQLSVVPLPIPLHTPLESYEIFNKGFISTLNLPGSSLLVPIKAGKFA